MKELIWLQLLDAIEVSLAAGLITMAVIPEEVIKLIGGANHFNSHPLYFCW